MPTTTDTRTQQTADDDAALALELRLAARASTSLRRAIAALTAAVLVEAAKAKAASLDGKIPPQRQAAIRALFAKRVAELTADVEESVNGAVTAGIALALKQEAPVLRLLGAGLPGLGGVSADVRADPVVAGAGRAADRALADEVGNILKFGEVAPLRTEAQVRDLAARAGGAARVVERDVRTAANRALNATTVALVQAAEPATAAPAPSIFTPPVTGPREPLETRVIRTPSTERTPLGEDLRVVWVAERGACLVCLALSGQVADPHDGTWFDEFATFGKHPMPVWPPDQPLMGPPRHPHCRCRLRIIAASNTMLPAALAREARRSVARGFSDYDSRPARLAAADRLLATANGLPITVQRRAAVDVARGKFSTRHRPRLPELRADLPLDEP